MAFYMNLSLFFVVTRIRFLKCADPDPLHLAGFGSATLLRIQIRTYSEEKSVFFLVYVY